MMFLYSYTLMFVLLTCLLVMLMSWSWVIEFSIVNLKIFSLSICVLLEKETSAFLFTVICIFLMVFWYSFSYLSSEVYLKRFLMILSLFVISMCLLILSGNLFSSLIGWDGLGVTSLFLILFYYSKSAMKASTLTFLMNRSGDCFFIMALAQILLMGESQIFYSCSYFPWEISLLLGLASITKSAQIPFSTWLPAAMEAPTPVSSLVHSSTLVTAGIFLLFRYNEVWCNSQFSNLLLILSISTCFMASLAALTESDLKKLIALSTLSQLGFIMFSLSLGLLIQGFMHMLMHAFFKALLFMCAGLLIHSFKGSQSVSNISLTEKQSPLVTSIMSLSFLSMMGLPFLSGFYSKDYIIDSLKMGDWSLLIILMLVLSLACTVFYSMRTIWYLFNSTSNWHCMSDSDLGMVKPMIPLAMLACFGGSLSSWLLTETSICINSSKISVLTVLSVSAVVYWVLKSIKTSAFLEKKWNLEIFNPALSNMLFYSAVSYKNSSDLMGVPEVVNSYLKYSFKQSSNSISNTMKYYSGNLEFLLFLTILALLVV